MWFLVQKTDFGGLWKYFAFQDNEFVTVCKNVRTQTQIQWGTIQTGKLTKSTRPQDQLCFRLPSHYKRRGIALPTLRATPNLVELDKSGNCRAYFSCRMLFRYTSRWAVFVVLQERLQMSRHVGPGGESQGVQPIGCGQWVFPGRCSPCGSLGKNTETN